MQEFEQQPEPVNFGTDIVVTNGGQLQAKKVYHAAIRARTDVKSDEVKTFTNLLDHYVVMQTN